LIGISDADVAAYRRDGVVCLRGQFDARWIERIRGAIERDLAAPGPSATNFAEGSSAGRFFGDMFMWKSDPDFRAQLKSDPRSALSAELGVEIPEEVTVHVHEETVSEVHLVLPPANEDLSDAELEMVSGGTAWGECSSDAAF